MLYIECMTGIYRSTSRRLKTVYTTAHPNRSVYATHMAFGYGEDAVPTIDLTDADGRRHLIRLTAAQMAHLAATAATVVEQEPEGLHYDPLTRSYTR